MTNPRGEVQSIDWTMTLMFGAVVLFIIGVVVTLIGWAAVQLFCV